MHEPIRAGFTHHHYCSSRKPGDNIWVSCYLVFARSNSDTPPPMSQLCIVTDTTGILRYPHPFVFFRIRILSCLVNVNIITSRTQEVQVRISEKTSWRRGYLKWVLKAMRDLAIHSNMVKSIGEIKVLQNTMKLDGIFWKLQMIWILRMSNLGEEQGDETGKEGRAQMMAIFWEWWLTLERL